MIKKYKSFLNECKKQNVRLVKKNLSIQTFSNVSVKIDSRYLELHKLFIHFNSTGKALKGGFEPLKQEFLIFYQLFL